VNVALAQVAPGLPPLPLAVVQSFVGEGARRLVGRALERQGLAAPVDDVLPLFMRCYEQVLLDTTRAYAGIPEALDRLGGRRLAVLTNKPGRMSRALLEGLGLAGRFRRVIGGDDLATRKPDPEGLRLLLAEAGVDPHEAALVGDSAIDVRTARACGVRAVGVSWGFDPGGLSREPPDVLVERPQDLAAAL
jgi:phosphoglycolate phosphatase